MSTKYLFVAALKALQIDSAKLQVETQIMDQSLAVMLRQFSFIVLLPSIRTSN